jgi:parvulin-like peptidyl-prolyl isomerase
LTKQAVAAHDANNRDSQLNMLNDEQELLRKKRRLQAEKKKFEVEKQKFEKKKLELMVQQLGPEMQAERKRNIAKKEERKKARVKEREQAAKWKQQKAAQKEDERKRARASQKAEAARCVVRQAEALRAWEAAPPYLLSEYDIYCVEHGTIWDGDGAHEQGSLSDRSGSDDMQRSYLRWRIEVWEPARAQAALDRAAFAERVSDAKETRAAQARIARGEKAKEKEKRKRKRKRKQRETHANNAKAPAKGVRDTCCSVILFCLLFFLFLLLLDGGEH